jgi:hypothetical protein
MLSPHRYVRGPRPRAIPAVHPLRGRPPLSRSAKLARKFTVPLATATSPSIPTMTKISSSSAKHRSSASFTPQCNWKGLLADYASHVHPPLNSQNPLQRTDSALEGDQSLLLNTVQQTLPQSKAQNCACNKSIRKPISEAIDLENRLRSFIDRLQTEQELADALTKAMYFNEYIRDRINQLPKFEPAMRPLPRDSLKINSAKIKEQLDKGEGNSPAQNRKARALDKKMSKQLSVPIEVKDPAIQTTDGQTTQETQTEISLMTKSCEDKYSQAEKNDLTNVKDSAIQVATYEQSTRDSQTETLPVPQPTGAHIAEIMNTPNKWSEDFRSEFLWKDTFDDHIRKYDCWNFAIMKQSLSNFGGRKKYSTSW